MPFSVEVTPRNDTKGVAVHEVVVTIDGHETVVKFVSGNDAERFAEVERARLVEDERTTSQRVREIAYRLWEEEGCPQGDALRHWFAARSLFERDNGTR
jgi:Protein of unknown function (DUF2934)